jgi:hypothetical protein
MYKINMKTYIFTFDVNGGDDIKTGILQTQNKPRCRELPEFSTDTEFTREIVRRCIVRFIHVNENNLRLLEERFWKCICCYLKTTIHTEKKLEINILSLHEVKDKKVLNEKITDATQKYDIFINCCNIDPADDYFIFEGDKVIFFNINDYTTKDTQIS